MRHQNSVMIYKVEKYDYNKERPKMKIMKETNYNTSKQCYDTHSGKLNKGHYNEV